jgi:CheY-like chemotaxis protein
MSANLESRVLVVDDCEPLRYLKTQYLLEAGFLVSQADTGRAALRSIETERPDIVLLDVNLPDMHGSEVCREVKTRWDLPVIYTSSVDVPAELHGMADGCLVSLDEEDLVDAVRKALEGASLPKPQPGAGPAGGGNCLTCAKRSSPQEIAAQVRIFESGLLREVLDASSAFMAVLNENREIVFCNRAALSLAGVASLPAALGLRLGEAFHSVHTTQSPEGSGTIWFCQTCGAVRAVFDGPRVDATNWDFRMVRSVNGVEETCELMATTLPVKDREGFVVCTLADFSQERRRQANERLFFHDILNIGSGLKGCAALLRDQLGGGTNAELAGMVEQCAAELLSEIQNQRQLLQAEAGQLSVTPEAVGALKLVQTAAAQYRERSESKERTILIDPLSDDLQMETDPAILSGVLGRMLENALVATEPGGTVTIGCEATQGGIEFCVHNPGVIPRAAQRQIFQGPLSARGGGRILGTYSMRLLTERYLGGTVRFESSPLHGTRFVAHYPTAVVNAAVEAAA